MEKGEIDPKIDPVQSDLTLINRTRKVMTKTVS